MRTEVRETIQKFYHTNTYVNPLANNFDFSKTSQYLPAVLGDIETNMRNIRQSNDGEYEFCIEVIIEESVVLYLSWLGPYATHHSNFTSSIKPQASTSRIAAIKSKLDDILNKHHVIVLSREAVLEKVQWIEPGDSLVGEHVKVWNCLFCEY